MKNVIFFATRTEARNKAKELQGTFKDCGADQEKGKRWSVEVKVQETPAIQEVKEVQVQQPRTVLKYSKKVQPKDKAKYLPNTKKRYIPVIFKKSKLAVDIEEALM